MICLKVTWHRSPCDRIRVLSSQHVSFDGKNSTINYFTRPDKKIFTRIWNNLRKCTERVYVAESFWLLTTNVSFLSDITKPENLNSRLGSYHVATSTWPQQIVSFIVVHWVITRKKPKWIVIWFNRFTT